VLIKKKSNFATQKNLDIGSYSQVSKKHEIHNQGMINFYLLTGILIVATIYSFLKFPLYASLNLLISFPFIIIFHQLLFIGYPSNKIMKTVASVLSLLISLITYFNVINKINMKVQFVLSIEVVIFIFLGVIYIHFLYLLLLFVIFPEKDLYTVKEKIRIHPFPKPIKAFLSSVININKVNEMVNEMTDSPKIPIVLSIIFPIYVLMSYDLNVTVDHPIKAFVFITGLQMSTFMFEAFVYSLFLFIFYNIEEFILNIKNKKREIECL